MKASTSITTAVVRIESAPALLLRKILVPVDFSAGSFEALRYAATLAELCHASLVVLHVMQLNIGGEELGVARTKLLNKMADQARVQIRHWAALLPPGTPLPRIVVTAGQPHEEIGTEARELGADLIVLSAHRYGGLLRLVPHTAPRVIRHAPCPVLVLGASARAFPLEN